MTMQEKEPQTADEAEIMETARFLGEKYPKLDEEMAGLWARTIWYEEHDPEYILELAEGLDDGEELPLIEVAPTLMKRVQEARRRFHEMQKLDASGPPTRREGIDD